MSLREVEVATAPPYRVRVGPRALEAAGELLVNVDRAALVADARVLELHGARLRAALGVQLPVLALPPGESTKSLARLGEVLDFLAGAGLSRRSLVLTFGGGVIGDLGGLGASLFKRGCGVAHVPSTLLAQVDASVGGKTAINLAAGKNLAGTFHQPRAVLADTTLLATLPPAELRSGLGEVLKTALIGGPEELERLTARAPALLAGEAQALAEVVADCVAIKARVVASDPDERGPRRVLNLGHTFAHAIEHVAGYGNVPHGVAVAVGIVLAADAAAATGALSDAHLPARVRALAGALDLPASLAALRAASGQALATDALIAGLAHDKKGRVGTPEFVLPRAAGSCALGVTLEPALLARLFA